MKTFHASGDKQLRSFYSIDIEEKDDTRIVHFNSTIWIAARTRTRGRCTPTSCSSRRTTDA